MELKAVFESIPTEDNSPFYLCNIRRVSIKSPETKITRIIGDHIEGKNDDDVNMLLFDSSEVHFFPRGLDKIFKNLTGIMILSCGLKRITRNDLVGLTNLKYLTLDDNQLRLLSPDLFVGMNKLKHIAIRNNKLRILSSKLLKPIAGNAVTLVDLRGNTKIDACFHPAQGQGNVDSLQELMEIIDKKCVPPFENNVFKTKFFGGYKQIWESGKYSDFTVIGGGGVNGETKDFKVHKVVLASQSSVFAAMFENDMKEKRSGQMIIEDFSAETVEEMLEFLYTGELKSYENGINVYSIACIYDIETLKEVAKKLIMLNIEESNAIEVLGLANLHNLNDMKRAAFTVIKKTFPELKLQDEMMEKPQVVGEIIAACRVRNKMIENVEEKFQKKLQKLMI